MSSKKILIIAPLPPPYNGQSIATETLVKSKVSELYDLRIINISSRGRTGKSGEFEVKRALQIVKYIVKLFYKLSIYKPDLVYITISQSTLGFVRDLLLTGLTKLFKRKCIVHLYGGYFRELYENSPKLMKKIVERILSRVDIAIADSLCYIFDGLVPSRKIKAIPNCVQDEFIILDLEMTEKLERIKKRNLDTPFIVLYLSNLIPSKGYFDILRSAVYLRQKNLPIEFLFAGAWMNPKDKEGAEKFVQKRELNNIVRFLGVVTGEKKRKLLLGCDIFVLPTYYREEGFPISLLEAMGMGLNVITTDYRGIPAAVVEGVNGFFVPLKSPKDIADRIEYVFGNKEIQLKIAKNNIKKIKSEFTKDNYEEKILAIFKEVYESP